MSAIVMNTLNGAVTEYTGFDFHSVTPTHAGSALGLYLLGGNTDNTVAIQADVRTGKTRQNSTLKKAVEEVYFAMKGTGSGQLAVYGEAVSYTYRFSVLADGVSRATPGKGIRENYLAFGYRNLNGVDFQIDRIEALTRESTTRRI